MTELIDKKGNSSINIRKNEISFKIKMIQRLKNKRASRVDYKINVPRSIIDSGVFTRDALYNVILKWEKKEQSFMIKKIQKMGNYFKIAVPPDLINEKVIPRIAKYVVTLKLLKQKLSEGIYKFENGEFIEVKKEDVMNEFKDEEGVFDFKFD